jgi:hypothetical protein
MAPPSNPPEGGAYSFGTSRFDLSQIQQFFWFIFELINKRKTNKSELAARLAER